MNFIKFTAVMCPGICMKVDRTWNNCKNKENIYLLNRNLIFCVLFFIFVLSCLVYKKPHAKRYIEIFFWWSDLNVGIIEKFLCNLKDFDLERLRTSKFSIFLLKFLKNSHNKSSWPQLKLYKDVFSVLNFITISTIRHWP